MKFTSPGGYAFVPIRARDIKPRTMVFLPFSQKLFYVTKIIECNDPNVIILHFEVALEDITFTSFTHRIGKNDVAFTFERGQ